MNKVKVLNVSIQNISINFLLKNLKKGILITPNVDHVMKLQKDSEFYKIYQETDWVICDSKVLSWGARFLGTPIVEVIPGSSFFPAFYEFHKNNNHIKIFLLGALEGVAQKAQENINIKVGRNIIVGTYSPSFGFEKNEEECQKIVNIVNSSEATVLVVGLGAPKQEKWIYKYYNNLPNIEIFMALGATIDFEAGNIQRAPIIFRKFGLEWLFRLLKEPKRLWKRYLIDDLPFFYYILKQKFGKYKDPFLGL